MELKTPPDKPSNTKYDKLTTHAFTKLSEHDYIVAAMLFKRALAFKPNDVNALYNVAAANQLLGNLEVANQYMSKAIDNTPEMVEGYEENTVPTYTIPVVKRIAKSNPNCFRDLSWGVNWGGGKKTEVVQRAPAALPAHISQMCDPNTVEEWKQKFSCPWLGPDGKCTVKPDPSALLNIRSQASGVVAQVAANTQIRKNATTNTQLKRGFACRSKTGSLTPTTASSHKTGGGLEVELKVGDSKDCSKATTAPKRRPASVTKLQKGLTFPKHNVGGGGVPRRDAPRSAPPSSSNSKHRSAPGVDTLDTFMHDSMFLTQRGVVTDQETVQTRHAPRGFTNTQRKSWADRNAAKPFI